MIIGQTCPSLCHERKSGNRRRRSQRCGELAAGWEFPWRCRGERADIAIGTRQQILPSGVHDPEKSADDIIAARDRLLESSKIP